MGRLVITQKGRDVRRVAASVTAYLAIGALAAASLWFVGALVVITARDLMGGIS